MYVPFLDDDSIYHCADGILRTHHPSFSIPVPIERIIEIKLDLRILSVKDLESGCGINGSVSKDFRAIVIDEDEFEKQVQRARFTLAHELGHVILHRDLFIKSGGFNTDVEFVDFQNGLPEKEYKKLEIQAFRFAEEILFPRQVLKEVVEKEVQAFGGLPSLNVTDLGNIISKVSSSFDVTERATLNKLNRSYPSLIGVVESNAPF